ncbi:8724_t:CDS:1 [Gigaspora margarita]|uniref:8724_t:CDS:1 n=1 Tax=Gigaspora margarita TaxID=4874 RepID=A0ABN7V7P1_GIGMA|nr:8724_t:CDS:1 [Gigaspora margarita]
MDESKWEKFTKDIKNRINGRNTDAKLSITDEKTLNKKWHNLNFTIKQAAVRHTYKQMRRFHAFSQTATNLYKVLPNINKLLRLLLHIPFPFSKQYITTEINRLISTINGLAQCNIVKINKQNLSPYKSQPLMLALKKYRKAIWQARNTENNNVHRTELTTISKKDLATSQTILH